MFWKHLSLLSYNVKHQNQSKQLTAPTASLWVIVRRLLKWYQCSGDGWKLQEESVELNCWQQESQYISRSSSRLLVRRDDPTVLTRIVNTHCLKFSLLHFLSFLLFFATWEKLVPQQGYQAGGTPAFGLQVVVESSQFCMFGNCHQKWIKWSHL